jgi:hypothetical protein
MHQIAEKVRAANDNLPRELVPVDAWGVDVWVYRLSAVQRLALEDLAAKVNKGKAEDNLEVMVLTVALAVRDEHGTRVFTDDDLGVLRMTDPLALHQAFAAAARLNSLTARDHDKLTESFGDRQGEGLPSA